MKIFIPFDIKDIGGPSTFARKFKAGMEAAGHEVVFNPTTDYDILLLIVQCPLKYLLEAKRNKKKIVQRLDGTYYWTVSGWKFPLLNLKAAYIRHFFTDYTIYQSRYSQDCANRFLGKKKDDRHSIIYNGVDTSLFKPDGPKATARENPDQKLFFTASAFRREDQILPLVEAVKEYHQRYDKNFLFYIAGTFKGKVAHIPNQLKGIEYIKLLGKVNNDELPKYERSADVFLFTHLNPPCPNNIIEAMACGLPICGINDGAMPELVKHSKNGRLTPIVNDGFWFKRKLDPKEFSLNIREIVNQQTNYSLESRKSAETLFSIDTMTASYIQVFELIAGTR